MACGLIAAVGLGAQAPLTIGETVSGTITPGETDTFVVEILEPSFVLGQVDQISVDVEIVIFGADGEEAARIDALGVGGERFSGRMRRPGRYQIQLVMAEQDGDLGGGEYAITLRRLEPIATDPARLVDQLMSRYDGPESPGAAVQVWRDGKTIFSKAYGMAHLAYGIPFAPDTRTNIGSTSKQFTAFAVMLQQAAGKLSLDDGIRTHIPELPEFADRITIRHLLTHTSGLREFLNLIAMTGRRLDRGDWIDRDELIAIVQRQPKLQNEPGTEWNYNNTAYGLAALIVERTSGQDFDVFMKEQVFEPLGMAHTMVRRSPLHIVPGMAEGYTPTADGYLQIGDLGGAVGAGAIYSSVEDLQRWVENFAEPRVGSAEILAEMMTPHELENGESTGYGLGLGIDEHRGLRRVQHNGADVAHRSSLVYYPEINAGITTQSNHAEFKSSITYDLAEAFFADAMEPKAGEDVAALEANADAFDPETFDPEAFDAFVGRYAMDASPDFILTFTREGEAFYVQATGQPRLSLTPTSMTSFRLDRVEAAVTFHRDDEGGIEGVTLSQNGENHATRLEGEAAEAWTPSATDLEAFVGRYFSEELETFYEFRVEEGALVGHQRRIGDVKLASGKVDSFSWEETTLTFERDRNDRVIGFYLENGRTRDVRFARVR